jgi:FkbM family methyltransferase
MLKQLRISFIRQVIEWNEKLVFSRRLMKFYAKEMPQKVNRVMDVGANLGQTIDEYLKVNSSCEIIAFEPNPTLFANLKKRYQSKNNVILEPLGISNEIGTKTFYENIFHSTSSFEPLDPESEYLQKKAKVLGVSPDQIIKASYPVEITTLAHYINNKVNGPIAVLKIDTEGHELACLHGLFAEPIQHTIEFIQLEVHNDDMYLNSHSFEEITQILEANGYVLAGKIKHGFGDFYDAVFRKKS